MYGPVFVMWYTYERRRSGLVMWYTRTFRARYVVHIEAYDDMVHVRQLDTTNDLA